MLQKHKRIYWVVDAASLLYIQEKEELKKVVNFSLKNNIYYFQAIVRTL